MPTAQAISGWEPEPPKIEQWVRCEEPDDLKAEIEQAREMLELADNWDGEGSQTYSKDTFDRAVAFLTMHSDQLLKLYHIHLPAPKIGPGPDGSVDLHWKRRSWELLVNIPADAKEMAVFYGDNYGAQKIKGSVEPRIFSLELFTWLMN
jgi:hypothetical protein